MSGIVNLLLGVVTSIGGFVEVGSISTAAQAGAEFGFQLLWAVALAGLILAMLVEMSGRLAIVSKRTLAGAIRERFGVHFQAILLAAEVILDTLLMTAEIGGAAIALTLVTGMGFQWWILPIGAVIWLILWTARFAVIEDGLGVLGLVTLAFVVSAWQLHPEPRALAGGFVPSLPGHGLVRYAFLAISIVGATVSPYLLNFYASGAIEERMSQSDLWVNRTTAFTGMGFGSVVSMGVLVTAAMTLKPQHILVDSYEQAALMFVPAFGRWAVALFAGALFVGCVGAAVEIALNAGYVLAQVFGWTWGANRPRRSAARFSLTFSLALLAAVAVALVGFDPLQLTMISVALTVVVMPILVLPFLVLMNDAHYVGRHTSGPIGNGVLAAVTAVGALLALVVIPVEILGG
jgi:NRAMP (natural resistance-associated macrophage protein)-like metal ion transporter